jgi:hypothetical protein
MRIFFITALLVLTGTRFPLMGVPAEKETEAVLQRLFGKLAASRQDQDKKAINDSIVLIIDNYAASDTVMEHSFSRIRNLGQITSRNSKLKIITWNLLLENEKSRYFCYFVNNSGKGNIVYKLVGTYREEPVKTDIEYSGKDWYGALYYDLRPAGKKDDSYWILLGIDLGNPSVTRKIIDAVSFNADGSVTFGRKIFLSGKESRFREVLEYNPEAVVSLRFFSDKTIVFDHLVPVSPSLKGMKEHYAPDFSYDAYTLERGGVWRFVSDFDARNSKE